MINDELLEKISENTGIIVWTDKDPLSKATPHFLTINYLTDDLLIDFLKQGHQEISEAYFVHKHFNRDLLIYFKKTEQKNITPNTDNLQFENLGKGIVHL